MKPDENRLREILLEKHDFLKSNFPWFQENWNESRFKCDVKYRILEIKHILKYVSSSPCRVLEIGLGGGQVSFFFHKLGYDVYGLDDDEGGKQDKESLTELHPGVKCEVCQLERDTFPYKDDFFDFVVSMMVLEHLPCSPKRFLSEVYRVLRPRGRFYLAQPNIARAAMRIRHFLGKSPHSDIKQWFNTVPSAYGGHVREYTLSEIRYMFQEVGFTMNDCGYINLVYYYAANINPKIRARFLHRILHPITILIRSLMDTTFIVGEK